MPVIFYSSSFPEIYQFHIQWLNTVLKYLVTDYFGYQQFSDFIFRLRSLTCIANRSKSDLTQRQTTNSTMTAAFFHVKWWRRTAPEQRNIPKTTAIENQRKVQTWQYYLILRQDKGSRTKIPRAISNGYPKKWRKASTLIKIQSKNKMHYYFLLV